LDTPKRAIIYIASGEQYIDEAMVSAKSVDGQCFCVLATPDDDNPFSNIVNIITLPSRQHEFWFLDGVNYLNWILEFSSFNQLLLLDTDTYICGSLSPFFDILNRFDIAGTHAIGRETLVQRGDLPISFPELHCGAISFNCNAQTRKLFQLWLELFVANPEFYGNNDQGPLREALWAMPKVRLGILPSEFCFRYRWGGLVNGQVRILHGRENSTPYEQIAKQVNGKGIRVYGRRELA